ncbi:MAG: hypothetical protein ABJA37_05585 [Ferruginibacter sp.]
MNFVKRSNLVIILVSWILIGCKNVVKLKEDSDQARKTSDSFMREFKRVDSSLINKNAELDSTQNSLRVGTIKRKKTF